MDENLKINFMLSNDRHWSSFPGQLIHISMEKRMAPLRDKPGKIRASAFQNTST